MPDAHSSPTADAGFWACPGCRTPNPAASYIRACVACGRPRPAVAPPVPPSGRSQGSEPPRSARPRDRQPAGLWLTRATTFAAWGYAGLVLASLALIRLAGDRWWAATCLLFSPRWVFLLPLLPLGIAVARTRRRLLWGVWAGTLIAVGGPLMGLNLPVGTWLRSRPTGQVVRVLSYNVQAGDIDREAFARLLESERIDVVLLQEYKQSRDGSLGLARAWHVVDDGAILTRFPVVTEFPYVEQPFPLYGWWPVEIHRVRVGLPEGSDLLLTNAHMPTMRYGFEYLRRGELGKMKDYTAWRWRQVGSLVLGLSELRDDPQIVGGDFNMPPDSPMMDLMQPEFQSAFEVAGFGYGYTRPNVFPWMAIDQVFGSPDWVATSCRIGPNLGSDHLPVIAEFVLRDKTPVRPPTAAGANTTKTDPKR